MEAQRQQPSNYKLNTQYTITIMAEPEVATKAPESDAAEASTASIVPGDTPAQTGASMGGLGEVAHSSESQRSNANISIHSIV